MTCFTVFSNIKVVLRALSGFLETGTNKNEVHIPQSRHDHPHYLVYLAVLV